MTHSRALPRRAESPSTRGSDRDHQMKPGNDHIQKHTSGKPSLKRRLSLVELSLLFEILFRSAEAPRGGSSATAEKGFLFFFCSTGQRPPLTRRNTNAVCFADTLEIAEGSAPKRKAVVRLHALSFYTRTAGRGACGETRMPTVIGLFC